MRARHLLLLFPVLVLGAAGPASAVGGPVEHERIAPDPHDDLTMNVILEGDLPAAIETHSGVVSAPDPHRPIAPREHASDDAADPFGRRFDLNGISRFVPDKDTRRPDVLPYEDPFTPSTAPFKRMIAFDAVDSTFALIVADKRLRAVPLNARPAADGSEEQFYGDIVIDAGPGRHARVPSVGAGAKVLHARISSGPEDIPFRLVADGAENWFVDVDRAVRGRLIVELSIPRETFGGEFGDPGWSDLQKAPPLPRNVAADANKVALQIGASHALSPRENVKRMVEYFRSFVDSEEPPSGHGDVYLDLALSHKGVCRHRAYAFLVTALGLGIPTRMVMNEAHAWVEVHDGSFWKRIDLGGAGRTLADSLAGQVPYEPPPDPFAWPPNATRGDDLAQRARAAGRSGSGTGGAGNQGASQGNGGAASTAATGTAQQASPADSAPSPDTRPVAAVVVGVVDVNAHRGSALHVRGTVQADGPCGHVVVELTLRDARGSAERFLGALATGDDGTFTGALVLPEVLPLGDYDLVARTPGDAHCGPGSSK